MHLTLVQIILESFLPFLTKYVFLKKLSGVKNFIRMNRYYCVHGPKTDSQILSQGTIF